MPTVRTNGVETYYERYGTGPPVIVVHGALNDHRVLSEQLRPLAETHELILYDLRGHGHTGPSDREHYSMSLFADDLAALVEALELDSPAVFGHSMGGMIVQAYGSRYRSVPRALVAAGAHTPNTRDPRDWLYFRLYARMMYGLTAFVGRERVFALANRIERLVGNGSDLDDRIDELRTTHDPTVPDVQADEFRKVSRAVLSFFQESIDLDSVTASTLVLYGEHEPAMTARHAAYIADAVQDGRCRMIEDAGHAMYVERPSVVVSVLREFLGD